jgi:alginate O-acetyltransferase complex protein AlgI
MALTQLLILIGFSLLILILSRFPKTASLRNPFLLIGSVMVLYWLQPALPIRGLDFWLPTATLFVILLSWIFTARQDEQIWRKNFISILLIVGTVLLLSLTRYLSAAGSLTASRPPQTWMVGLLLVVLIGLFAFTRKFKTTHLTLVGGAVVLLLALLVLLKLPQLTLLVSQALRGLTGQSPQLASAFDIRWLGFSYIAFRLIHTLRDRQSGRLPSVSLEEYFIYILFFPAITAGPIDRVERFVRDLRQPLVPSADRLSDAGMRLAVGLFKKYVLADTLAMFALNATNAGQLHSTGWTWVLLYAYSFQILLDFSGYTDIAIGLAGVVGIRLPENFNRPYLKPNLTQFWNNWHMTLTQWFRAYFFNPVTRAIRSARRPWPVWGVILLTQVCTMLLIGLWHGITLNFIAWGLWHGIGLFLQNRWSEWVRPLTARLAERPKLNLIVLIFSTFLTFQCSGRGCNR